jgi:hypothetical protein
MVIFGIVFLPMSIGLFVGFMDIRRIEILEKIIVMGVLLFLFLSSIYVIFYYGFRKRHYFITIDDEGIQEYARPKCAWSDIKEMAIKESHDIPVLILKYKDPLTLKLKKIKISPDIYGVQVAVTKIINRLKDETLIKIPQEILEEIEKKTIK